MSPLMNWGIIKPAIQLQFLGSVRNVDQDFRLPFEDLDECSGVDTLLPSLVLVRRSNHTDFVPSNRQHHTYHLLNHGDSKKSHGLFAGRQGNLIQDLQVAPAGASNLVALGEKKVYPGLRTTAYQTPRLL